MKISARSALIAGVATLTISAVAAAPSVQPLPPPRPAVELTAAVQPLAAPTATNLTGLLQRILLAPGIGTPPPPLPPPIVVPTPGSIGSSITNIYIALEPWVHYGFELAQYAVSWIPYVGWLAPQIDIFYHLGESIVHSIVFNIADWLDGNQSFGQGLIKVGQDTIDAFINFGVAQWHFWLPSIPLPPLPGIFTASAPATTLAGVTEMPGAGVENAGVLGGLLDRVLNPVNADGGVGGAFTGGASRGSLFRNGFAGLGDLLGGPLSPPAQEKTSEITTVPSIVKTPFAPLTSFGTGLTSGADIDQTTGGPLTTVTKTLGSVHNEIRTSFNATNRLTDGAGTNGVVQAQGEVRGGGVARAANDVVNALRAGKPSKGSEDGATASTTVSKSFGDTVKKVVNDVRQGAKNRTADK